MEFNQFLNQSNNKGLQKIIAQGRYIDNHISELKIKREAQIKSNLLIRESDLNNGFILREDLYLKKYPDADPIDFINKELDFSNKLLTDGKKLRLEIEYFYSIKKHIIFLEQCKKSELDDLNNNDNPFVIKSDHSAMFVVTLLLQLTENGAIKMESYSHMARIIKKYFRCNGSDEIKSAESLISKIRNNDRSTEKIIKKVREILSKDLNIYT
jgi:hypothetical protein